MHMPHGEEASLFMEAKDGKDFITFYIGSPTGSPAWTPRGGPLWPAYRRKKTPSQMKRDQRRKEVFLAKKKQNSTILGDERQSLGTVSLKNEVQSRKSESSTIPQLDGACESESEKIQSREVFSFKSYFPEDDIENHIDDVFKNTNVSRRKIILKDQLRPENADHLFTLELIIDKDKTKNASFLWPQMSPSQKKVFQDLERIL
jgi:hypothetical protein